MVKKNANADEYKEIFVKLHHYQRKGADNLIMLLTKLIKGKASYMASYIELVAERTGVSSTGHITTTHRDIMLPIVKEIVHIKEGAYPLDKDINKAWEEFLDDYRNNRIKL